MHQTPLLPLNALVFLGHLDQISLQLVTPATHEFHPNSSSHVQYKVIKDGAKKKTTFKKMKAETYKG